MCLPWFEPKKYKITKVVMYPVYVKLCLQGQKGVYTIRLSPLYTTCSCHNFPDLFGICRHISFVIDKFFNCHPRHFFYLYPSVHSIFQKFSSFRAISYKTIANPVYTDCLICLEPFYPDQNVEHCQTCGATVHHQCFSEYRKFKHGVRHCLVCNKILL